jgi:hypothetical protein
VSAGDDLDVMFAHEWGVVLELELVGVGGAD